MTQEVDMNGRITVDRLTRSFILVVGSFLCFIATAPVDAGPFTQSVTISVFADRYLVGDLAFDDLDYLEQHITAMHVGGVELLICGAGATRSLKAIVHRFRHVPVQMRVPDVDELQCMSKAPLVTPVRQRAGRRPSGINDEAVERYWLDMMP
jgi:hypothetical protein